MGYKDKDKQREANRERQRRYKVKQKALLSEGVTQGVTDFEDLPPDVQQSIEEMSRSIAKAGIRDYESEKSARTERAIHYQHQFPDKDRNRSIVTDYQLTDYEREHYKPASELEPGEHNPVSKPGAEAA